MAKLFSFLKYTLVWSALILITSELLLNFYISHIADLEHFLKFASLKEIVRKFERNELDIPIKFHPYLGYTLKENYIRGNNRHNSLGFRGSELPPKEMGEVWIACVGGSTTYDDEIEDWKFAYPAQLEKILTVRGYNVRVINAGTPGWTSWEILIDYLFRLSYLPVDILIFYECANELGTRLVYPPSAYKPDNTGTRSTFPGLFYIPWWEEITLIRVFLIYTGRTLPHATYIRTFDKISPTNFSNEFVKQNFSGTYPSGIFREVPYEKMLEMNPPIYFERNLRNLVLLAKSNNVKPVLATFAIDRSPGALAKVCGIKDSNSSIAQAIYKAVDEMNEVIKKVAEEASAYFFDFASVYPNDPELYVDSLHNTEKGAKLKAELFADYLIKSELVSK